MKNILIKLDNYICLTSGNIYGKVIKSNCFGSEYMFILKRVILRKINNNANTANDMCLNIRGASSAAGEIFDFISSGNDYSIIDALIEANTNEKIFSISTPNQDSKDKLFANSLGIYDWDNKDGLGVLFDFNIVNFPYTLPEGEEILEFETFILIELIEINEFINIEDITQA